ncbi:MAG: hypothetical protein ACRD2T_08800 [Thermoanaerobaculia bacterium]
MEKGASGRDPDAPATLLMEELKRRAERICALILHGDPDDPELAMERFRLRQWCERVLPDRVELYDWVYESRFERLLHQFGGSSGS